jgi:rod shape-determining protein MreD
VTTGPGARSGEMFFVIGLTFYVAFILMVIPMPEWGAYYRPDWAALVLVYWAFAIPDRVGPLVGFGIGFLVDLLLVQKFGLAATSYAVLGFLAQRLNQQIRMFPVWQQAISIGVFIAISKLIFAWLSSFVSAFSTGYIYWLPILSDMIVWPLVYFMLREIRQSARIS